ncbi:E3 ubiquitin-protein ligase rad18 [Schaereria dolodes]|nr:E3 ubiquitin-protein ligase rad18 [Schaereria dolodes]
MDSSIEVPDSSDWLNTPVAPLHAVEAGLRCQVCKDFFDSPMITSCSHTFCSLCIRRCLVHDGKCPTCRAADQELRLRKNGTVAELVEAFQAARPSVIQLGKDVVEIRKTGTYGGHKRKLGGVARDDTEEPNPQRQKTRSQSRRSSRQQAAGIAYVGGGIYEGTDDGKHEPDDSMTACPICNRRMKEEDVFLHLDTHQDENEAKHPLPAKSSSNRLGSNDFIILMLIKCGMH